MDAQDRETPQGPADPHGGAASTPRLLRAARSAPTRRPPAQTPGENAPDPA